MTVETMGAPVTGGRRLRALLAPGATVAGVRSAVAGVNVDAYRWVDVWLYRAPTPASAAALGNSEVWRITPPPGARPVMVRQVGVEDPDNPGRADTDAPGPRAFFRLYLGGEPDRGRYRVEVVPPAGVAFDPLRTGLAVHLRVECPDRGGCARTDAGEPGPAASPVHDYTARDWHSLRRALLEYLRAQDPDADLSIADPTVTLVEAFAHAGDLLHYRLDRVATEAYLETARLRTSVRRHARLVDHHVDEGAAARTWVHVSVTPATGGGDAAFPARVGDVAADLPGSPVAFTLEADVEARASRGEIALYDWGEDDVDLPAGATEAVLVVPKPSGGLPGPWLAAGMALAFEVVDPAGRTRHASWARAEVPWPLEVKGSVFRAPLPSRPAHVVRLTEVELLTDPLAPSVPLLRVRWAAADALPRAYPVSITDTAGGDEVTVARADLVPAHHGRLVDGPPGAVLAARPEPPGGDGTAPPPAAFWLTAAGAPRAGGAGLALTDSGSPHRLEAAVTLPSGFRAGVEVVSTLLEAAPGDLAAVLEFEEHEPPLLRFRTGAVGLAPPAGSTVTARYEVGGGAVGNVGANALAWLERATGTLGAAPGFAVQPGVAVRNPVPATGGRDPVDLDVVRRAAPEAFVAAPRRVVLPADHAAALEADPAVERAHSTRSWFGSRPVVTSIVDLCVAPGTEADALAAAVARLEDLRMLGTEAVVTAAVPVGLTIALDVRVTPGADPDHVRRLALAALRPGTDARPGVFHRSRLVADLGSSRLSAFFVSSAVAAVAALPGVDAVTLREARRPNDPFPVFHGPDLLPPLVFRRDEIPVLDDDPTRPHRGRLDIRVTR